MVGDLRVRGIRGSEYGRPTTRRSSTPPSWRAPPAPTGMRPTSPETSTKGRRFVGTPAAGVEKVSRRTPLLLLRALSAGAEQLPCWGACPPPSLGVFSRLPIHPTTENRCGVVGDSEPYVHKTRIIPARILAPDRGQALRIGVMGQSELRVINGVLRRSRRKL